MKGSQYWWKNDFNLEVEKRKREEKGDNGVGLVVSLKIQTEKAVKICWDCIYRTRCRAEDWGR